MQSAWRDDLRFAYLIEPPFCYRTPEGTVTGCDVEVARAVIASVGGRSFDAVETEFAELLPGLVDGRWRMTTGLFATDERREKVDFSRPVWALTDGLLVRANNPRAISGYGSIAKDASLTLATITHQVQHETALNAGIPAARIRQHATYQEAAGALLDGAVDAYASVGMAHRGYLKQNAEKPLSVVEVPASEKLPEFGAFAFAKANDGLKQAVDDALTRYLGSAEHRAMMATFGFTAAEVDLVAPT